MPGYSVSSMILRGGRRLFLAGAPRFGHRGKVIAFQLKRDGAVRVAQSLEGEQVGHWQGEIWAQKGYWGLQRLRS